MRIGILGGTFDPVHSGHTALAQAAVSELKLDRLLLMPSGEPPHKKPHAGRADRLEMTRLAAEELDSAAVCDIEMLREGPTYAADTLRQLKAEYPEDELIYILGSDAAAKVHKWRDAEDVMRLCSFACVTRAGACAAPDGMTALNAHIPDISSEEVRRRIAEGVPIDDILPEKVAEYIDSRGLYIADMPEEDIISDLRARLKPGRFSHTLGVAQTCRELAALYGASTGQAYIAGLLHDCAKYMDADELLKYADMAGADADERACIPVLHAPVGAYIARTRYGVENAAVLSAIRRHTVGAEDMSLLDAIVYVADMVEPGRAEFPGLEKARETARRDIYLAAVMCGKLTRDYNSKRGGALHPATEKMIKSIEPEV